MCVCVCVCVCVRFIGKTVRITGSKPEEDQQEQACGCGYEEAEVKGKRFHQPC